MAVPDGINSLSNYYRPGSFLYQGIGFIYVLVAVLVPGN